MELPYEIEQVLRSEYRTIKASRLAEVLPELEASLWRHPNGILMLNPDPDLGFIMQWVEFG
jgi:hypothetical protein